MQVTKIEWCRRDDGTAGFTANPLKFRRKSDGKVVWGCVKTSPGCANCYAEAIALRFDRGRLFNAKNMEELEPFLDEVELRKMLVAKTVGGIQVDGSRVFVCDMTDVFGAWVPDQLLNRLFATFALRPAVTFQILTKRADRMAKYLDEAWTSNGGWCRAGVIGGNCCDILGESFANWSNHVHPAKNWPLPNVWLGVSCENQEMADQRIPHLLATPAAIRFLSVEPMLGPVDLRRIRPPVPPKTMTSPCHAPAFTAWAAGNGLPATREVEHGMRPVHGSVSELDALTGDVTTESGVVFGGNPGISWVIVGGESGHGARPMHVSWVRAIRDQCRAARVAFFMKQWGQWIPAGQVVERPWLDSQLHRWPDGSVSSRAPSKEAAGRLLDGQEYSEYPTAEASRG